VPHYSRLCRAVIDVPGDVHDEELAFWQGAIGATLEAARRYPEYHGALLPGQEFGILVQRLEDGPARLHLDIHTDDLDAEVGRLEQLGATRVRQVEAWWIMRDPAGLLFCVVPDGPDATNASNAHRWD
jgi:hypothetical protein